MKGTNNVGRINKSECVGVVHTWKPQLIEPIISPTVLHGIRFNVFIPPHPQKVHTVIAVIQHTRPSIYNVDVVYAQNTGILVLMNT
jgi:hypothetical protein